VKRLGLLLFLLQLLPIAQVGCVALVHPPVTTPMILKWTSRGLAARPYAPSHFRWIPLKFVPETFLSCVWQSEDRHFFEHRGFDWEEIRKAREEAEESGKPARGASTITQQCARSLFLWQGRSWIRKGLESYYTVLMELLLSKKRILELYVNVIEFGDGVYGVEAASQYYYGISANQLTLEQASMLVAIMPNPRVWDPRKPNERTLRRQAIIRERAQRARLPPELHSAIGAGTNTAY